MCQDILCFYDFSTFNKLNISRFFLTFLKNIKKNNLIFIYLLIRYFIFICYYISFFEVTIEISFGVVWFIACSPLLEIVFLSKLIFHPSRSMDFPCSNPDILMRINLFTERIARSWSRKRRVMEIGHCFKQINPLRYHVILKSRIYINVFHRIIDRIINAFHRIHKIWKRVKLRYIIKINYPIIFFYIVSHLLIFIALL